MLRRKIILVIVRILFGYKSTVGKICNLETINSAILILYIKKINSVKAKNLIAVVGRLIRPEQTSAIY